MFTTHELEAAGQRAASHAVGIVPDVAEIQQEVTRRRQSKRLLVGASTAAVVLFGIGGLLLVGARDNQVQVITASPAHESGTDHSGSAGQEAGTGADSGSDAGIADDETDDASGAAGEEGDDGGAGGSTGPTTTIDVDGDQEDDATDGLGDESADDGSGHDHDHDHFALPEDTEEWLEELKDRYQDEDQWKDHGLWPSGFHGFDLDISFGQQARDEASEAESNADDTYIEDGRPIWIERGSTGDEQRQTVTVSTLVNDEWFVSATGPADEESNLLLLIRWYDGDWETGSIPAHKDWMGDWDWPQWPSTKDDFEDWKDAGEDWLNHHEELAKDGHEHADEDWTWPDEDWTWPDQDWTWP